MKNNARINRFAKKTKKALSVDDRTSIHRGIETFVTNPDFETSDISPDRVPSEKKLNMSNPLSNSIE
jgi:hypothetical protein